MSNIVNLADRRAQKLEAEEKAAMQVLLANLDAEVWKPGPADKYFELRLRDAVMDELRVQQRVDYSRHDLRTSTFSFVLQVDADEIVPASHEFDLFVERVVANISPPILYLHSIMVARQGSEWSLMVRYYSG